MINFIKKVKKYLFLKIENKKFNFNVHNKEILHIIIFNNYYIIISEETVTIADLKDFQFNYFNYNFININVIKED